jgi:hypothetical protein
MTAGCAKALTVPVAENVLARKFALSCSARSAWRSVGVCR